MEWTVRGSSPGGVEIFRTRPERPCGPPSLLYNGYRVISWRKAAGTWHLAPRLKKGYRYTSTPLLCLNIMLQDELYRLLPSVRGRDSSVDIVTRLWAERSGDPILAGAIFLAFVQKGPVAHSAPIQWVLGHFRGQSSRSVALTIHPI